MAIREQTLEEQVLLREEEEREQKRIVEAEERRLEHDYRIAKLKFATQPRYKSFEQVIVSLTKALALPVAIVCITILVARGKDVPEALTKFITI